MNTITNAAHTQRRMRDVAFALFAAAEYKQHLNRIRLQKFIYLNDIAAILFNLAPQRVSHKTYFFGPYDPDIQVAANCLVFRGLAASHNVSRPNKGKVFSEFSLTEAGKDWVDRLSNTSLGRSLETNLAVAERVNHYGWYRLKALVYAEPTYVAVKRIGLGQELNADRVENNSSAQLFSIINGVLNTKPRETIPSVSLLDLFFRYLDSYDVLVHAGQPDAGDE